jgi:hypothetical protein
MKKLYIIGLSFVTWGNNLPVYAKDAVQQDTIARRIREFTVDNPMWLEKSMSSRYSLIQLGYSQIKGEYRTAQDAQKIKNINFNSEGTVTIKDVRLWGRFAYNRSTEDSTRFAHQTRENPASPWYFGSYGYNHYERTNYLIQTRGQKYFADRKYSVFGGLDYHVGNHFSNNDPRGTIDAIQVNGSLGASMRIAPEWELGVEGKYGYGQEQVEIAYRNEQYALSAVESPYMNYIVRGYGWKVSDWLSENSMYYQNDMKRYGGKLYLSWEGHLGKFYGNIGYLQEEQRYRQTLRSESRINELSKFNLNQLSYQFLWNLKRENRTYMVSFNSLNHSGKDWVAESGHAQNYVYRKELHTLDLSYLVKKKKWHQLYEGRIAYNNEVRHDGGTETRLDYDRMDYALSTLLTYATARNQEVEFGVTAFAEKNMGTSWTLPLINENVFHQYVFYHDILYRQADVLGGSMRLGFTQRLRKNNFIKLVATYTYRKADQIGELDRINLAPLGRTREVGSLRLSYGF